MCIRFASLRFTTTTHHHPRAVHEGDDGEVERVAELEESRGLVGARRVDRAREVLTFRRVHEGVM